MSRNRVRSFHFVLAGLFVALLFSIVPAHLAHENGSERDGLTTLLEGNKRFVAGQLKTKNFAAERPQLAEAQHPYAIILTCADSRLSPEIIFDESLGRLFVVRTAGEVVDPVALGSIEYAVEHLHVNLLFVLGHDSCGAVKATISGGDATPNIRALLTRIKPAVDKARAKGVSEEELLPVAIAENVRYQMQRSIFESDLLSEYVREQKLTIAGGVYHLLDGRVEILTANLAVESTRERSVEAARDSQPAAKPLPKKVETLSPDEKTKEAASAPVRRASFAESIQTAFEKNRKLVLKKTMLMRNEHDGCATDGCRSIPAGELVSLASPLVLNVMGRPQLKVRYKGRPVYILAEADALEIAE